MDPERKTALSRIARAKLARTDFRWFLEYVWPVIEPTRALQPSVAIDGVCAALQAVADGRIRRLAIEQPPGTSKSKAAAVAFPAYLELKTDGAARVMCGSYSSAFAERDSRHCRDLILSDRFMELVGGRWGMRGDAASISDYWFTGGGRRVIVSPGGRSMGERCTFQIIDDALSSKDCHSAAAQRDALNWVGEMLPSRLEDQNTDPRVLVAQRLCVNDPMKWARDRGWKVLCLPAVLGAGEDPCALTDDSGEIVWTDPRVAGEPIGGMLDASALAIVEGEVGPSTWAAQYLQKPHDDSSSMFKRGWFERRWTNLPDRFDAMAISLDASLKEGDSSDFAVIQVWGARGADRYLIEQWRKRAGYMETAAALREIRDRYPFGKVLVESAANGVAVFDALKREVPGIFEVKPIGGKVARAFTVEPICASGVVLLPEHAPWVNAWIDEVTTFGPDAKHDDQVDAMVYSLRELQMKNSARLAARW